MTVISQKRTIVQNVQKKEELISKFLTIQILKKIFICWTHILLLFKTTQNSKKRGWGSIAINEDFASEIRRRMEMIMRL